MILPNHPSSYECRGSVLFCDWMEKAWGTIFSGAYGWDKERALSGLKNHSFGSGGRGVGQKLVEWH